MRDVNWWLMALSFLIGLGLTLLLMIRRVTREVPVTHTVSAGLAGGVAAAGAAAAGVSAKLHGAAETVSEKAHEILERDPYGAGSIRVTRRSTAPEGYTIKGDKDTGRYFTVDSPEYAAIEAEVWFANESSAEKAGFLRWDAKAGSKAGDAGTDASRAVITGGTSTPDSAATVVKGGATSEADTSAKLVSGGSSSASGAAAAAAGAAGAAAAKASAADVPAGPHGKGSARAGADGSGPAGWTIKGNEDSMLYHTTDSPAYDVTVAEVWFYDEATAEAAGFSHWDRKKR